MPLAVALFLLLGKAPLRKSSRLLAIRSTCDRFTPKYSHRMGSSEGLSSIIMGPS